MVVNVANAAWPTANAIFRRDIMIKTGKLNELMDILFLVRKQINAYHKTNPDYSSEHEFIEEIRKLGHEIETWCNEVNNDEIPIA
jgi:urease alpha subunit